MYSYIVNKTFNKPVLADITICCIIYRKNNFRGDFEDQVHIFKF